MSIRRAASSHSLSIDHVAPGEDVPQRPRCQILGEQKKSRVWEEPSAKERPEMEDLMFEVEQMYSLLRQISCCMLSSGMMCHLPGSTR